MFSKPIRIRFSVNFLKLFFCQKKEFIFSIFIAQNNHNINMARIWKR